MSLVLGTESQLTPKRLRSLRVAQTRDDELIEQAPESMLLPPLVRPLPGAQRLLC